ncbi:MAG: flagellar basal body rod protein FlgC [Chthonomonas sp.]|nr:flagellar basal body rod protein FlgC [Chthonomonas sp.]
MGLFGAMRASSSGMTAERFRMDVISMNIAGANTVKTPDKDAYRRQDVVLTASGDGVKVTRIDRDQSPLRPVYEPGNPAADENGFVYYSNVKPLQEMVDMMSASRAYEANVAAFNSARGMIRAALTIGKI